MKIIIFGANEVGYLIASQFYTENDVIVIEKEKDRNDLFNKLDVSYIDGVATDVEILRQADIKSADVFIACTDSDELNIVACLTAKKISCIRTICFAKNEEYKTSLGFVKDADYNCDFYIDNVVCPKELLTQEIYRIITVAKALDVEDFAGGKARLLEYKIGDNSMLVNKMVKDCDFPKDTLIVGITRGEELFMPAGETVLTSGDKVIFMGLSHSLDVLAGKFFHEKGVTKKVTIIGGGSIGHRLARSLEELKYQLKIIERDEERCEFLAEHLNNTLVINGDGTDIELLNEEDIASSDVVICVTNSDEKNLLCSLMAQQMGVKRVISRASTTTNANLFEKVGVDIAISSRTVSINEIKNNLYKTNVGILATVEQGKGEVINILLPEDFAAKKIMELKLPQKAIIGIIQRRNRVIIPNGATQLMAGDNMIVFTTSDNAPAIKEYFKVN